MIDSKRTKRSFIPYKTGKEVAGQVSNALDHLLFFSGYDKRIRPHVSKIHDTKHDRKVLFFKMYVVQT